MPSRDKTGAQGSRTGATRPSHVAASAAIRAVWRGALRRVRRGSRWGLLAALIGVTAGCAVARPGRVAAAVEVPAAGSPAFEEFLAQWFAVRTFPDSLVEEYPSGDQFYPQLLESIRAARRDIRLEMYLFWSGAPGSEFVAALAERARAGVRVRMLLDWVGCRRLSGKDRDRLREAGVRLRFFHGGWLQSPARLNHRDHRKLLVVDGEVGWTGGAGVARMWNGAAGVREHWRDSMYRLRGPVVSGMAELFDVQWTAVTGEAREGAGAPPARAGEQSVQVLGDGGGDARDPIYESLLLALRSARRSVRLGMAYFVPDRRLMGELEAASRRGVQVEIVVPGKHMDSWPVTPAARSRWGRLLKAGARVYRYLPAMYHTKVLIIDDTWVSAGSANWDNRSLRLNDEVNFHVLSRPFAAQAVAQFEADKLHCQPVTLEQWRRRPVWQRLAEWLLWPLGPAL